ncbi:hypothetical protein PR202_ga12319 [Eleusine coracana subsp. coracana]|uniref:non-specific serine/threonine protein kinase n=1 Tax=Eleusine coracana subsp. coracana TaxID=191504 RepID=A0AAV5CBM2_ELECO|nr:hypothetical protein PR202_ga12319 [Eleusine coracana subsp. coracana]
MKELAHLPSAPVLASTLTSATCHGRRREAATPHCRIQRGGGGVDVAAGRDCWGAAYSSMWVTRRGRREGRRWRQLSRERREEKNRSGDRDGQFNGKEQRVGSWARMDDVDAELDVLERTIDNVSANPNKLKLPLLKLITGNFSEELRIGDGGCGVVYKSPENETLSFVFTDELRGLEWHTRYQIIKGICEGLNHLHKEKQIIHMDLKPDNILLDEHMVPKITDFGVSRFDDKSQTMTADHLLSMGYCAPEYLHHGRRSAKSDIYSLGVIILELVTGSKENRSMTKVLRRWKHRWNKSAMDTTSGYKQVAASLDLAQKYMQMDPADRPNIWDLLSELNKLDTANNVRISGVPEYSELEDMIGIEPLEMRLPIELNKEISCSIELTNDTDDYFAFRISTTSLRPYCVLQDKDIVPPRSKYSVIIVLKALDNVPPHNYRKDEFSVQSTRVNKSFTALDIAGVMFNEDHGKAVDKVNVMIFLDAP